MPYVEALLPTIVVALVFWFVIRAVSNVDRTERAAEAEVDAKNQLASERDDRNNPKADK